MEGRFLALDVGTRRIGVAASAPGGMAMPLETVDARDRGKAARRLVDLMTEHKSPAVVVGWPLDMQGREGRAVERVEKFMSFVRKEMARRGVEIPIHQWDERLTTTAADRMLIEADLSRSRRKEAIDQVAACHILQGFLEYRERR